MRDERTEGRRQKAEGSQKRKAFVLTAFCFTSAFRLPPSALLSDTFARLVNPL
jgi:hypothetical protein